MSQVQMDATALLCRLLELDRPEINGQTLATDHPDAAHKLLHERLLVLGRTLDWVGCPECHAESARVVREMGGERIALRCPECGDLQAPSRLRQTHKVPFTRFLTALLNGLELSPLALKLIEPDTSWRLGSTEPWRGKVLTWYFGRQLDRPEVAARLREQIALERSTSSCVVLTSSEVPLSPSSPLTELDVRALPSMAHLSQSKFNFFVDRLGNVAPSGSDPIMDSTVDVHGSTLRFVRSRGKAVVDGIEYSLEPRQQALLLALMDDRDHEMDKSSLKAACGSQAQVFSPSKEFLRNPYVYSHFIRYLRDEARYALLIPEQDRNWLP